MEKCQCKTGSSAVKATVGWDFCVCLVSFFFFSFTFAPGCLHYINGKKYSPYKVWWWFLWMNPHCNWASVDQLIFRGFLPLSWFSIVVFFVCLFLIKFDFFFFFFRQDDSGILSLSKLNLISTDLPYLACIFKNT